MTLAVPRAIGYNIALRQVFLASVFHRVDEKLFWGWELCKTFRFAHNLLGAHKATWSAIISSNELLTTRENNIR